MKINKLLISLLIFVVSMFTTMVIVIPIARGTNDSTITRGPDVLTAFIDIELASPKELTNQELISYDKTNVISKADLKKMFFFDIVDKIKIESFFDALLNDDNCSYDSKTAFRRQFNNFYGLKNLKYYQNSTINILTDYSSHVVASAANRKEITEVDTYIDSFEYGCEFLSYAFVITGYIIRCSDIDTMIYREKVSEFGKTLEDTLSLMSINPNTSCLNTSEYTHSWFEAELIRIMKIQVQFDKNCSEYQQEELSNIIKKIKVAFKIDHETLCSNQTSEIIDDHAILDDKIPKEDANYSVGSIIY